MEEVLFQWLVSHSSAAPWIIFGLLVIAGFSFPISEDLLLILSGVLASTTLPEYTFHLFAAVFFGSYISDQIAYGLGRFFGPKIYARSWIKKEKLEKFCHHYGVLALCLGRCIPFGLRNGIFMSAGAGKMPFVRFLIVDGISCFCFCALLFFLSFECGKNYQELRSSIVQIGLGVLVLCIIAGLVFWLRRKRAQKPQDVVL
jgi:membrane-associated protein